MIDFMTAIKNQLNESRTENGALGYATTDHALLDMNFKASSYRNASDEEIIADLEAALDDDATNTIKWIFFARDIRGGLGERRLFRVCIKYLAERYPDVVRVIIPEIVNYGRFDDLFTLLEIDQLKIDVYCYIINQLADDLDNMVANKLISLLAKWMPSVNTSSESTKALAKTFCKVLQMSEKSYRQMLSKLRAYLDVVEVKMCANNWSEIDYAKVPSKANMIYKDAFSAHDFDRREEYLASVLKGEAKINSSACFPSDVIYSYHSCEEDATVEAMWKAMPQYNLQNTLVVADVSGSMLCQPHSYEVAESLAIYTSEHNEGIFKDKFILFSDRPAFIDLSRCNSLYEKHCGYRRYNDYTNTNIEAVFNLVLETAQLNLLPQEEMPKNILIISDMEFDEMDDAIDAKLFDQIKKKYEKAGYKLPRCIFWNVASRTNTIPLTENELGVALVSGYSIQILDMIMSDKLDAYECLLEKLQNYNSIITTILKANIV